uniref:Uncharacterized protein n=1 Tax=Schistocephalus solidus TaxID=70667 RepID=A0A0V0J3E8_SCHSO
MIEAAHAFVIPCENFGLVELECVVGSHRINRDLTFGVISTQKCRVFSHARLEQSSSFSDVVARHASTSHLINDPRLFCCQRAFLSHYLTLKVASNLCVTTT